MSGADVSLRVRQVAADTFDTKLERISPESSPKTVENWDSLTHLNFVLGLEETFSFRIEPDESERMYGGIAATVEIVERKLAR